MCYIAGWGTKKVKGPATRILHEAALPLVSHEQCNGPKSYSGVIGGNLICAGYKQGGVDTCEGDSGGEMDFFNTKKIQNSKESETSPLLTTENIFPCISHMYSWVLQYLEIEEMRLHRHRALRIINT